VRTLTRCGHHAAIEEQDMGARQWLGEHPAASGAFACVATLVALFFILVQLHPHRSNVSLRPARAFFSDDDGKTYFPDNADKLPPFDHDGKTAYGAMVLRCADKKPFVAFLLKYEPADIGKLEERIKRSETPGIILSELGALAEVKRPGESRWVSFKKDPKGYARVTTPACPGGGDAFTSVVPGDPDSGETN
jgi:hypothetical protein